MEKPIVCPFCADAAIEPIPGATVNADTGSDGHRVAAAQVYHCHLWHVFAVFPVATLQEEVETRRKTAKT